MLVVLFILFFFFGLPYVLAAVIGLPVGILKLGYDAMKPEAVEARRKKQARRLKKQKRAEEAERLKREAEYLEEAKKTWEFK